LYSTAAQNGKSDYCDPGWVVYEYFKAYKPKVLYIAFNETNDFAGTADPIKSIFY
jgi:hypothetical protein